MARFKKSADPNASVMDGVDVSLNLPSNVGDSSEEEGSDKNLSEDFEDIEEGSDDIEGFGAVSSEVSIDLSSAIPAKKVDVSSDFVRVRAREDHKCNINGTVYLMYAGKIYNVPQYVKDILLRAGKLDPV